MVPRAEFKSYYGHPIVRPPVWTHDIAIYLFTGGLARGLRNRLIDTLGAVSDAAPPFPYASAALAPLRAQAEHQGRGDFSPLWAGQGVALARVEPAAVLTERLGAAALSSGSLV